MKIDILSWLKQTGGRNFINRRAEERAAQQPAQTQPAATKVTLSKSAIASIKAENQINLVNQVTNARQTETLPVDILKLDSPRPPKPPSVRNNPANNQVNFGAGNAGTTNTATVNGRTNTVDFTANAQVATNNKVAVTGDANLVRGYNGGQNNNTVNIQGSNNRLMFGQNAGSNTVTAVGNGNRIELGSTSGANVQVTGSNVNISVGGAQGGNTAADSGWTVNINASNVTVFIKNGTAELTGSDKEKERLTITIDKNNKKIQVGSKWTAPLVPEEFKSLME
jgi:hypothetical protein